MAQQIEPYEGKEPYAFISYCHKDTPLCKELLAYMSKRGIRLWYDRGIEAGESWTKVLAERLSHCHVFVMLVTDGFVASKYCNRELHMADHCNIPILPILIKGTELPADLEFFIGAIQYIEVPRNVIRRPEDYPEELGKLCKNQFICDCKEHIIVEPPPTESFLDKLRKYFRKLWKAFQKWRQQKREQRQTRIASACAWLSKHSLKVLLAVAGAAVVVMGAVLLYNNRLSADAGDTQYEESDAQYAVNAAKYNVCEDYVQVVGYEGSPTTLEIPSEVDGLPVTTIESNAFRNCTSLTSITIPDSVTTIGDYAFRGCASLRSITLPDSVTTIEACAFRSCTSLTSITIPDSVTDIGTYAFEGCTSLRSITLPDSVTTIEGGTFSGCTSLTSIAIPNGVTAIGDGVFSGCTALTSITLPDSVATIGNCAFSGCALLTDITIPDGVTSIGSYAFNGCASLTNITIPNGITSIAYAAFKECTMLTGVTLPDSVTALGYSAFQGCTSLTDITLPDSVTTIGIHAFSGCASLTSVTIPDSVTDIEHAAFDGCISLESVSVPYQAAIDDYAFPDTTTVTRR